MRTDKSLEGEEGKEVGCWRWGQEGIGVSCRRLNREKTRREGEIGGLVVSTFMSLISNRMQDERLAEEGRCILERLIG